MTSDSEWDEALRLEPIDMALLTPVVRSYGVLKPDEDQLRTAKGFMHIAAYLMVKDSVYHEAIATIGMDTYGHLPEEVGVARAMVEIGATFYTDVFGGSEEESHALWAYVKGTGPRPARVSMLFLSGGEINGVILRPDHN